MKPQHWSKIEKPRFSPLSTRYKNVDSYAFLNVLCLGFSSDRMTRRIKRRGDKKIAIIILYNWLKFKLLPSAYIKSDTMSQHTETEIRILITYTVCFKKQSINGHK